jgi:hypothetical protein
MSSKIAGTPGLDFESWEISLFADDFYEDAVGEFAA